MNWAFDLNLFRVEFPVACREVVHSGFPSFSQSARKGRNINGKGGGMFIRAHRRFWFAWIVLTVWIVLGASSCSISAQAPVYTPDFMETQSDIAYDAYAALAPDKTVQMTPTEQEVLKAAAFDVAAIHPVKENGVMRFISSYAFDDRGNFKANGISLQFLISMAWGIGNTRILGGPGWIVTQRYTLDARSSDELATRISATSVPAQRMIRMKMLQALLADRFQLKTHVEMRDRPVLFLDLAKGGSRLKPASKEQPDAPDEAVLASSKAHAAGGRMIEGYSETTGHIAMQLAHVVHRVVLDRSGLKGKYNYRIEWSDDSSRATTEALGEAGASGDKPPLPTALEQQLGLKLTAGKAAVEVLVIDSVQAPSEN
jgi:uncharacterized protein (TIGR03435 family)